MEQRNLKPKEILYGLLLVATMFFGYASFEFGNYFLGVIALVIVLIVVFYEILHTPKEVQEKVKENENKSLTLKLSNYIQIALFLVLVGYIVWIFVFKGA